MLDVSCTELSLVGLHPSFHLSRLSLRVSSAVSPAIFATLFATSSASLRTLVLEIPQTPSHTLFISALPLLTNSLTLLVLVTFIPGLGPTLTTFTSLKELSLLLHGVEQLPEVDSLLTAISPTLEKLWILVPKLGEGPDETSLLEGISKRLGKKSWQTLYVVEVAVESEEEERRLRKDTQWKPLLQHFGRRRVGVVFKIKQGGRSGR